MKAQGLPINFIVIAALAILILVLIAAFIIVFRGKLTQAFTPEVARANCEDACRRLQTVASATSWNTTSATAKASDKLSGKPGYTSYCAHQDIQNMGSVNCIDFGVLCYVTFADGVQKQVDCL